MNKARAIIKGGLLFPDINGVVILTQYNDGVEVIVRIHNLPPFSRENGLAIGPFAFHIHNGKNCEVGTINDQFPLVGTHYNPDKQPHGNHAGDFPVLMPNKDGTAITRFITDKFKVTDVIGLPILVHLSPDDYRTEPSGNSGIKIACGIIASFY